MGIYIKSKNQPTTSTPEDNKKPQEQKTTSPTSVADLLVTNPNKMPPMPVRENSSAAKKNDFSTSESDAESSWHEELPPHVFVRYKEKAYDFFKSRHGKITIILSAVVVIGIIVVNVLLSQYSNHLLDKGKLALEEKNYEVAVDYLDQYASLSEGAEEDLIRLSRAYLMSGNSARAKETLQSFSDIHDWPEASFIAAAVGYAQTPQNIWELLDKSIKRHRDYAYLQMLAGVFALLENRVDAAQEYLQKAAHIHALAQENMSAEEMLIVNEYLRYAYRFYLQHENMSVGKELPLSFSRLKKPMPLNKSLGFIVNTEGFNNYYGVPLQADFLYLHSVSPIFDIVALRALAYMINEKRGSARKVIADFPGAQKSLLSQYILAYLDMLNKDTTSAQNRYAKIINQAPSTYAYAYAAGVAWVRQRGELASEEVLALYQKAVEADATNVVALNNYAFLLMYAGEEETAQKIIKQSKGDIGHKDKHLRLLAILLDIGVRQQTETTHAELYNGLADNPNSSMLLNAAVMLEKLSGNYVAAIRQARRLQELQPDEPYVVQILADIYELRQQWLLMVDTLKKGQEKFPFDEGILSRLILTHAKNGDDKKVQKLLQVSRFQINDRSVRLQARAILAAKQNADSPNTAALAKSALEEAPSARRKIEIANDLAHIYLGQRLVTKASYFYNVLKETIAKENITSVNNGGIDAIALQALDVRLRAADGNVELSKIQDLLKEAAKQKHAIAQIDVCWALAASGGAKDAIAHLELMRKEQGTSLIVLQALLNAYQQANDTQGYQRIQSRIAVFRQRLPGDAAAAATSASKPQRTDVARAIFSDESDFLESINKAVEKEDFEKAIDLYTQLINHETIRTKNPARTYQNRGGFYLVMRNHAKASEDYAKSLEIGGLDQISEDIVRHNYAFALFNLGLYEEVVEQVQFLLPAAAPEDLRYLQLLAFSQQRLSNVDSSISAHQQIIERYPEQIDSYLKIAVMEVQRNRIIQAVAALNQALEVEPRNLYVHKMLSDIYLSKGQRGKAKKHQDIVDQESG